MFKMTSIQSRAAVLLTLAVLAPGAWATFRGEIQCSDGVTVSGDTRGYSNENFNAARDAYYNVRLGVGTYRSVEAVGGPRES